MRLVHILVFLLMSCTVLSQHQYCSKYKGDIAGKRLEIEDLRSDSIDIKNTSVNLSFTQMATGYIFGNSRLEFQAKLPNVTSVLFDFEGLDVDSVTGESVSGFTQSDTTLRVFFDENISTTSMEEVIVYYKGNPITDGSGWGGFYFTNGFAWNLGVGFASDPHSYGRVWFPCFDNFIERSTFEFNITTPQGKYAACNGLLQSTTVLADSSVVYSWLLEQAIPSYLACVAVANYEVVESMHTGIEFNFPVKLYARPNDTANASASFIHLHDAIEAFEERFGVYKFDKVGYSMVPFNSGAMEHATNITYPISSANGGLGSESLMAHELGHMWWGDNVTCQTDGDMWINEGWASFSAYIFQEAVYGRKAYEAAMMEDLRYMLHFGHHYEGSYRAVSGQPHDLVYGDHVYKKGALVAHNLRAYMGDESFYETIDAFMDAYEYTPVSSDTLERFFTEYSGKDLSYFFRDWVYNGGYNVVVMDSFATTVQSTEYGIEVFLQQKLKGIETFHDEVPVYCTVYSADGQKAMIEGSMSGQYGSISSSVPFEPSYVVMYDRNEVAQARTRDVVRTGGPENVELKNMFWDIEIESVEDSAVIYFDHVWSYPDPIKDWANKAYDMSDYRYWKVYGSNVSNTDMNASFFYDGREGGNGYLDIKLAGETEDSLLLLYRENAYDDWEEYDHYTLNNLGSSSNAFGLIELSKVLEGEYVLANHNHKVLSVSSEKKKEPRVFPNPSAGMLNVLLMKSDSAHLELKDMHGKVVLSRALVSESTKLDISAFSAGLYIYTITTSSDKYSGKVLLRN